MNFFSEEMKKIFKKSSCHKQQSESNRGLYIKINDKCFAQIEFDETIKGVGFDRIFVKVINKSYGIVDSTTFNFCDFIGDLFIKYSQEIKSFIWSSKTYGNIYDGLSNIEYKKLYNLISGYFNMFV